MPFLSGEERESHIGSYECSVCKQRITSGNYCSRCDEFYDTGHKSDCALKGDEHSARTCGGDRGYR